MKWAMILSVSIILVGFCVTIPFARAEIVGAWTFDDVEGELNAEAVGMSQDISGNGLTGNIVGRESCARLGAARDWGFWKRTAPLGHSGRGGLKFHITNP